MASKEPFSFSERAGLLFTVEGAVLSLIAVTSILCFALFKWLRRSVITWGREHPSDQSDSVLFNNLMFADLIQAVGIMPNFKWMSDAVVTEGTTCTSQAVLKQVGIVGVSMTSLAIALHTFAILVLRWRPPQHSSKIIVLLIWVFTALVVGIPNAAHKDDKYYGPSGFWCWILDDWQAERIVTEYLWVWLSGLIMLLAYTAMYGVMRGWIDFSNFKRRNAPRAPGNTLESGDSNDSEEDEETKKIARMMLYFPLVYIGTFLPNSISRWLAFGGAPPSPKFTLFANTVFALSGLFNFILFLLTRPAMVVGERIVVLPESPRTPFSPSVSKGSFTGSSISNRVPELKNDHEQFEMHNSTGITSNRQMSTSSSQSGAYLTTDRQQYGRTRKTHLTPSEEEDDEDEEDCGRLPDK